MVLYNCAEIYNVTPHHHIHMEAELQSAEPQHSAIKNDTTHRWGKQQTNNHTQNEFLKREKEGTKEQVMLNGSAHWKLTSNCIVWIIACIQYSSSIIIHSRYMRKHTMFTDWLLQKRLRHRTDLVRIPITRTFLRKLIWLRLLHGNL